MPSPADCADVAVDAAEQARRDLRERGVNPADCRPLLDALERAVAGVLAATELGWDVEPRRVYLDEVRRRLEQDPSGRPPAPPRRSSLAMVRALVAIRAERGPGAS
jgi:hypothetical protein